MSANFIPPIPIGQFKPSSEAIASWLYEVWKYLQENPIPTPTDVIGETERVAQTYIATNVPPMVSQLISNLSYDDFVTGTSLPIYRASNDELGPQDLLEAWNEGCRFALVDDDSFYVMIKNGESISLFRLLTESQAQGVISVNGQTGIVVIPDATQLAGGLMSSADKIALDDLKTSPNIPYGESSTAGETEVKTVSVTPAITSLKNGQLIVVRFANTNTAANPKLNVNALGEVKMTSQWADNASVGTSRPMSWAAGQPVLFRYFTDGTNAYWQKLTQPFQNFATSSVGGLMSSGDKSFLDSIKAPEILALSSYLPSGVWANQSGSIIRLGKIIIINCDGNLTAAAIGGTTILFQNLPQAAAICFGTVSVTTGANAGISGAMSIAANATSVLARNESWENTIKTNGIRGQLVYLAV